MSAPVPHDDTWKTQSFRQSVRDKIEDSLRSKPHLGKSPVEIEAIAFTKAQTKDQYLGFVAKLIYHVTDIDPKRQNPGGPGNVGQNTGQDPMMALRTMTNQQQGMMGDLMPGPNSGPNQQQMGGLNPLALQQPRPNMMMNQGQMNPMMVQQMVQRQPPPVNVNPQQQMMGIGGPQQNKIRPQMQQVQQAPNQINQGAVHSPMGASMSNQMTPSPAGYAHSPSGGVVPSPVGVGASGGYLRGGQVGAPSPGSALNTPINSVASPASLGHQQQQQPPSAGRPVDDQLYLEKLKQLSKYIEPLKNMIARIDKEEDRKKDIVKMKSLLDILTDPNRRCSMDTLVKCEQVLERIVDLKTKGVEQTMYSHVPSVTSMARLQNDNLWQPLLDAINANIKSPMFNHTLQRVFDPPITMLMGSAYSSSVQESPPPSERRNVQIGNEDTSEIPDVLQGEIAHLDQRFKVQLDPVQHTGCRTVNLICQLDDKTLPCVPPISVTIPDNYPDNPPRCNANRNQYSSTAFLKNVLDSLNLHLDKMPSQYSITSLLDTWEMCVRQTCSETSWRSETC